MNAFRSFEMVFKRLCVRMMACVRVYAERKWIMYSKYFIQIGNRLHMHIVSLLWHTNNSPVHSLVCSFVDLLACLCSFKLFHFNCAILCWCTQPSIRFYNSFCNCSIKFSMKKKTSTIVMANVGIRFESNTQPTASQQLSRQERKCLSYCFPLHSLLFQEWSMLMSMDPIHVLSHSLSCSSYFMSV